MRVAPDPFKTKIPISKLGMQTYRIIAARLAALHPPIFIAKHIAESEKTGESGLSTLQAHDATLDGINFKAADPVQLARAFHNARDKWGDPALTSMKEDPDHWALKASFGKTVGTGWREPWRDAPYAPPNVPDQPGKADSTLSMRFGTAGSPIRFTALHCAVHEIGGQCNVHIDESGFVLRLSRGITLTPDLYDHIVNELKWKTEFRDWLEGKVGDETVKHVVREVVRRVSINFPNAANGYAGLRERVKSIRRPGVPADLAVTAAKVLAPIGVTVDVYDNDAFKVQVTGTILNGDRSITVTLGGRW